MFMLLHQFMIEFTFYCNKTLMLGKKKNFLSENFKNELRKLVFFAATMLNPEIKV